jgi:transcriptional regulator with XRE-family HTH domain
METLATRLKKAREDKGWTQTELAANAKVKQSFIGALEAKNQKTSGWLPEIAHALGVDAYWLKTGKGERLQKYSTDIITTELRAKEPSVPNIVSFPSPLLAELMTIAETLNEAGLNRLIGTAQTLAEQHPREHKGNAAS